MSKKKANLSILQIVDLVKKDEKRRLKDAKGGKISRIYKIFINETEHNFSFQNFSMDDIQFDGNEIEYLKFKNKRKI